MTVQRCDRCGVEIEKSWMNFDSRAGRSAMRSVLVTWETNEGAAKINYDLCPSCVEKLDAFVKFKALELAR